MISLFLLVAAIFAGAGWMAMRRGVTHASIWTGGWSVAALGLAVFQVTAPPPALTRALQRADDFNTSAGVVLGRYLAPEAGTRVLILIHPELEGVAPDARSVKIINGLRDGLGPAVTIVDSIAPPVPVAYRKALHARVQQGELSGGEVSLLLVQVGDWFSPAVLAGFMDEWSGKVDLIVSTVPLPRVARRGHWPRLAALNVPYEGVRPLVRSGLVEAAVTLKPRPSSWATVDRAPQDPDTAFAMRFLLLTPDNPEGTL